MKYAMLGNPKTGKLYTPHLIVAQSYDCNAKCVGCNAVGNGRDIDSESMKQMINSWAEYCDKHSDGKGIFHLKGGEPLMFEGVWDIMAHAVDKGLYLFITTNGNLIDRESAKKLADFYQQTEGQVIVSLDGSTPEVNDLSRPGLYKPALSAIESLANNDVAVAWNYRVHRGNQNDIGNAVRIAKDLGVIQFNDLYHAKVRNRNGNLETADLAVVLEQLERVYNDGLKDLLEWSTEGVIRKVASGKYTLSDCPIGFEGLLYVQPSGEVASCPNSTNVRIGNFEDNLESLFNKDNVKELRERHKGRLICKGELDASTQDQAYGQVLEEAETLIKEKIVRLSTNAKEEDSQAISWCFSRNW